MRELLERDSRSFSLDYPIDTPDYLRRASIVAVGLAMFAALVVVSQYNFLLFHVLAELFSIAVAWSVFLLIWNARRFIANNALIVLGIAYLLIGGIDLFHTLDYKGMGVFSFDPSVDRPTQLWVASRALEGGSLLLFSLLLGRRFRLYLLLWSLTAVAVLLLASIYVWEVFPSCYQEGVGLTSFKRGSEYAVCLVLAIAILVLYRKRGYLDATTYHLIVGAMALTIAAEISFTVYVDVYGVANLIGHYIKIASYFLVYLALIHSGLTRPYATLFKELAQEKEALRESEERYRITFGSIGEGVITTDTRGRITSMNPVARGLTGWESEEALGRPLFEVFRIYNIHTGEPCENPVQRVMETGNIQGLANHTALIDRYGKHYHIADSCSPIRDAQGEITGVVLTFRDVTESYRMQEALRESEHRYRLLFENAVNAVSLNQLILDEEGNPVDYLLLDANSAFEAHTGLALQDAVGRLASKVLPGIEESRFLQIYAHVVRTGESIRFEHYAEPLQRYYFINAYKMGHSQFATVFQDITAQKETEKQLQTAKEKAELASRHKSNFLARMSHEFRTPMNSILGMLRLVLFDDLPDAQRERVQVARDSAESLLWLVNDLLDFSSIEAGKFALQEREFRLRYLCNNVRRQMEIPASEKGLSLHLRVDSGVSTDLVGDSHRLKQVLINLLHNAIKFTEKGWVSLEVDPAAPQGSSPSSEQGQEEVLFIVRDTGVGIGHHDMERIFESYEQMQHDFLSSKQGIGLGLAICRKLVSQMGGNIWALSEPGQGSAFFVRLPFRSGTASGQEVDYLSPDGEWRGLPKLRVLIAEDERMNQIFTADLLTSSGHEVEVCEDGHKVLERLRSKHFDLVLMDIRMPVLDGVETAMRIRTADPVQINPDILIIGLSAHTNPWDELEGFYNAGFDDFVVKPVSFENLFQAISRALEAKAML